MPPVPSPCNGTCTLDTQTGWCLGCYRTGAEIAAWSKASDEQRLALLAELDARQAA